MLKFLLQSNVAVSYSCLSLGSDLTEGFIFDSSSRDLPRRWGSWNALSQRSSVKSKLVPVVRTRPESRSKTVYIPFDPPESRMSALESQEMVPCPNLAYHS